jgi:hypothetical protein
MFYYDLPVVTRSRHYFAHNKSGRKKEQTRLTLGFYLRDDDTGPFLSANATDPAARIEKFLRASR